MRKALDAKGWSLDIVTRHLGPAEEFLAENILPKPAQMGYDYWWA